MSIIYRPSSPIRWNWISLVGPDARDFLHRITSADVRNLELGQGTRGCFLNAQGRIRSYFTLWNYRTDEFAFELDAGETGKWKNELLAAIDQYTFAEKMTLADLTPAGDPKLECRWIFGNDLGAPAMRTLAIDEEIRICNHGATDFGRTWVTAWGRGPRLDQWLERALPDAATAAFEQLEAWRIEANRPWVDHEVNDTTGPLEIGLVDAVAGQKGCYPGQEVIEKIISLGAPAKRLAQVELEAAPGDAPRAGTKVFNLAEPPTEVGELTSVSWSSQPTKALASVRKIHAKEGLEVRLEGGARGRLARISPYV